MYEFVADYIGRAVRLAFLVVLLLVVLAFWGGWAARPHFPEPTRTVNAVVIANGATPLVILMIDSAGGVSDGSYAACVRDEQCHATMQRLIKEGHAQALSLHFGSVT